MIRPLLALFLCAAPLLAQGGRVATLGDRVKVHAPKAGYKKITGEVVATTPDILSLRVKGADSEVPVARTQIDQLYLSLGSHANVRRGIGLGALAGLTAYMLFGPRELDATTPGATTQSNKISTTNLVTSTAGGAVIGGLIGSLARSDIWVRITPAAARNP
jgi:hypothetical protein